MMAVGVPSILFCTLLLLCLDCVESNVLVETSGPFVHIYNPSVSGQKWYINDHTVIYGPGNYWHLIGITHSGPADPGYEVNLAHATSLSNVTRIGWTKAPFALGAIPPGETHLWAPHIVYHKGVYHMFYCGGGMDRTKSKIQLATSTDLWSWKRVETILTGGVDGRDPMVMNLGELYDNKWALYYTGTDPDSTSGPVSHVVYQVTSYDLVHWENETIVFDCGSDGHNYGGPCESPFVVRRGSGFYLFTGSWSGYSTTRVFLSLDPYFFGSVPKKTANQVGQIASHAAEVVRDQHGKYWITRCGWGQEGVYIAPLLWKDGANHYNTSMPVPVSPPAIPNHFNTNLKGWKAVGGVWTETPNGLQGMHPTNNAFYMSTHSAVNFTYQANLTLTTTSGDPKKWSDSAAALVFRTTKPTDPAAGSYVVTMQTAAPNNGILKLFKFGPYQTLQQMNFNVTATETYSVRVVASGANVDVFVGVGGGPLVRYISYNGVPEVSGTLGLNIWQSAASFQNVMVDA